MDINKLKRYDEIDFPTIEKLWENSINPIGVYIHSPFCPSICEYCIYAGTLLKNKEEYDKYYDSYLPKIINLYKPILEKKKDSIVSWFFGGGTPSMMEPKTLEKLLKSLPNFKESKGCKSFEIHPAYWSVEQLDLLKEYNFDNVTICLQTLDRDTLIKQKRVPATLEKIIELTKEIKKRNFSIFVDLISFLNRKESDVEILANDLEWIYNHISPDEVSISTLFQNKEFSYGTVKACFESKFHIEDRYGIEHYDENLPIEIFIEKQETTIRSFRFFKKETKEKLKTSFMFFMDPQYRSGDNIDTIAIGSYKNKDTQSRSNISHFNYIECNNDNNDPMFKFITKSFFDEIRSIIDIMERLGEPPKGLDLYIKNKFNYNYEFPLLLDFKFYHDTNGNYIKKLEKELIKESNILLDKTKIYK